MAGESAAGTAKTRLALLIGSPVLGLTGPGTDVDTMSSVLKKHDFEIWGRVVGPDATRELILNSWNGLIDHVSPEDVVVIYYSGHGGQIESTKSQRYNFIVPFDFTDSTSEDFRGILDIEIMHLVGKTTDKTKNVTLIFDCCYSSRTCWDPWHGSDAARKSLRGIKRGYDLSKQEDGLRDSGTVQRYAFGEVNQYAVQTFAAGATESAWEYTDDKTKRLGVFTRAFAMVLNQGVPNGATWRALLRRVCELVAYEFPNQQPWAEGPSNRVLFETDTKKFDSLPITVLENTAVLKSGWESGVREGSLYTIMPAAYDEPNDLEKLGEARVTTVGHLSSDVEYLRTPGSSHDPGPPLEAVLTTEHRAFIKEAPAYK